MLDAAPQSQRAGRCARSGARWEAREVWVLVGLLALFLASRWAWIQIAPLSASYWEEAYRWVAVEELASQSVRPLLDYQADHYQGGSLVVILLALVASLVAGVGASTLKLTALLFSAGILISLHLLGRRFFGRDVGMLAALAYLCGPPLVAFWGVCLMGFHAESVLPSLLLTHVTLALATDAWRGPLAWSAAGGLAGLSLWFTPTAGIAVAACALTWLLLRGFPRAQDCAPAVLGGLIGFSPWLLYNATHDWAGVTRVLEVFGARPSSDPFLTQGLWERVAELALRAPGEGLLDPGGALQGSPWRPVLFAGVLIPAGLGLLAGLRRLARAFRNEDGGSDRPDPERLELVFWLYAAIFVAVYLASRFTLDVEARPIAFRLLVPPAVFALVPLASSAARGLRAQGVRRFASGVLVCVFLLSLAVSTVLFAGRYEAPALQREHGYVVLGLLVQRKYPRPISRALAEIRPVRAARDRSLARLGVGWGLAAEFAQGGSWAELDSSLAALPEPERSQVWAGVEGGARRQLSRLEASVARTGDPDLERALDRLRRLLTRRPDVREPGSRFPADPQADAEWSAPPAPLW